MFDECVHNRYDIGFGRKMRQTQKTLKLLQAYYSCSPSHEASDRVMR